jgi:hypothetical protein
MKSAPWILAALLIFPLAALAQEEEKKKEAPAEEKPAASIFPDKNLEAVVRQYVFEKRNNEEPLTEKDVENISTITGKDKGVKDLTGLEKCRSLALLDLEGNEIEDLAPIKDRLDQLAGLVEVVVDDRLRVDAEGVVDRRQQLAGMHRVLERGRGGLSLLPWT